MKETFLQLKLSSNPQDRFLYWCLEREKMREHKSLGELSLTEDDILSSYCFCNVNREHDTVTKAVEKHVRSNLSSDDSLSKIVKNLLLARMFNQPGVLKHLETLYPTLLNNPSEVKKFCEIQEQEKIDGRKIFRGAYLVLPFGSKKGEYRSTAEFVYHFVTEVGVVLKDFKMTTFEAIFDTLIKLPKLGNFMINQTLTDLKYVKGFEDVPDWQTFCVAGPGTKRGLNRYFKRPINKTWAVKDASKSLISIRKDLEFILPDSINQHFKDLNNLSNCFCEFDKYERMRDYLQGNTTKKPSLRKYGQSKNTK